MPKKYNYAYTLIRLNSSEPESHSYGTFFSLKDAKNYAKRLNLGNNWEIVTSNECWGILRDNIFIIRTLINIHLGAGFCGVEVI